MILASLRHRRITAINTSFSNLEQAPAMACVRLADLPQSMELHL